MEVMVVEGVVEAVPRMSIVPVAHVIALILSVMFVVLMVRCVALMVIVVPLLAQGKNVEATAVVVLVEAAHGGKDVLMEIVNHGGLEEYKID